MKNKWSDYKSVVKSKAAKRKRTQQQTGGAKAGVRVKVSTLSEMEQRTVALIDPIAIHGIDGGIDSHGENSITHAQHGIF